MASLAFHLLATVVLVVTTATYYTSSVLAVPLQYTIAQRATECLYDTLDADEHVTLSVFITSGAELKATAIFEGPVAPPDATSGVDIQNFVKKYQMGHRFGSGSKGKEGNIREERTIDFETDDWDDDDDSSDDDDSFDDDEFDDDDFLDDDDVAERRKEAAKTKSAKERQEEREKRRKERRKKDEERRAQRVKKHNRASEGEADQETYKAEVAGWYRACVRGTWALITAEIEMRKESDLGGMNKKTGHVTSYERRAMDQQEKDMTADGRSDGLKDEDMKTAHDKLRKLNRLLNEIQEEQQSERRRFSVHAAVNEHSHSRMVLGSLLETALFIIITIFQIFTIHKWFSAEPMLGR